MKKENNQNQKIFMFPVRHSKHSQRRANQRGVKISDIKIAMNFTKSFFKQGLIFHVVQKKLIPKDLSPRIVKKIKNLVIIVAGDSGTIITCYKSENGMRSIKRKSKILVNYTNVA